MYSHLIHCGDSGRRFGRSSTFPHTLVLCASSMKSFKGICLTNVLMSSVARTKFFPRSMASVSRRVLVCSFHMQMVTLCVPCQCTLCCVVGRIVLISSMLNPRRRSGYHFRTTTAMLLAKFRRIVWLNLFWISVMFMEGSRGSLDGPNSSGSSKTMANGSPPVVAFSHPAKYLTQSPSCQLYEFPDP